MNTRRSARTWTINALESLDHRIVPSGLGLSPAQAAAREAFVTSAGGSALGSAYTDYVKYEESGHHGSFKTNESSTIKINGTSVDVAVQINGGNFKSLEKQLQKLGMKVSSASPKNGTVDGYVPIANLPAALTLNHEASFSPVYKPGMAPSPTTVSSTTSTPAVTSASNSFSTPITANPPIIVVDPPVASNPPIAVGSPILIDPPVIMPTSGPTVALNTFTTPTTTTTPPVATPPIVVTPTAPPVTLPPIVVTTTATNSSPTTTSMVNTSPTLQSIYQQYVTYVQGGSQGTFAPTGAGQIRINGTSVGVDISISDPSNLATMVATYEALGMQVTSSTAVGQVGIIEGYLPIAQLSTAASNADTVGVQPNYPPTLN